MSAIGRVSSCMQLPSKEMVIASTVLVSGLVLAVLGGNRLSPICFKNMSFSAASIQKQWKAISLVTSSVVVSFLALKFYGYESSLRASFKATRADECTVPNPLFKETFQLVLKPKKD